MERERAGQRIGEMGKVTHSIVHCPLQGYFEANLLMWIPAPVRMDTRATDSSKDQPARMDTRRRGVRGAKCSP